MMPGRGRGRSKPTQVRSCSTSSSTTTATTEIRAPLSVNDVTQQHIRKYYELDGVGRGKPRNLPMTSFPLRTEKAVREAITEQLGDDPRSRIDEECTRVGLRNLGLTCYINAVLQCLRSFDSFSKTILSLSTAQDSATIEFQRVIAGLRSKLSVKWIDPEKLIKDLEVCTSEQQDAHEFYRLLMNYLLATNSNNSAFSKEMNSMFEGGVFYTSTCSTCNVSIPRHEPATEIALPMIDKKPLSVEICLDANFNTATPLIDDNQYHCDTCEAKRDGERSAKLGKLPDILVFSISRFVYDVKRGTKQKKQQMISYPADLDMKPWVHSKLNGETKYSLCASVHHHGSSAHGGHYTAKVFDRVDNKWYHYDDTDVEKESKSGVVDGRITSNDVYMLYYERRKEIPCDSSSSQTTSGGSQQTDSSFDNISAPFLEHLKKDVDATKEAAKQYEERFGLFKENGNNILKARKEIEGLKKSHPVNDTYSVEDYSFIPLWWIQAFAEGKFIDPEKEVIAIKRLTPNSKDDIKFIDFSNGEKPDPTKHTLLHRHATNTINYSQLRCPHSTDTKLFLDPDAWRAVKVVHSQIAKVLIKTSGGDPRNLPTVMSHICKDCVLQKETSSVGQVLEAKRREEILRLDQQPNKNYEGESYWISLPWWNQFKLKKPNKEELLKWDLFKEARCEHGALTASNNRKLVVEEVFLYLTKELMYHAEEPILTASGYKDCKKCARECAKELADWTELNVLKGDLKRELKSLVDASRKDPTADILKTNWTQERTKRFKAWERKVKKIIKEKEEKRKKEEAQLEKQRKKEEEQKPISVDESEVTESETEKSPKKQSESDSTAKRDREFDEEQEETEENDEPEIPEDEREPSNHIDEEWILIPSDWADSFREWLYDSKNDVQKHPSPIIVDEVFYCKHNELKYDITSYKPPVNKKERDAAIAAGKETPEAPFKLVQSDVLETLRKHNFLDESKCGIPTYKIIDRLNTDDKTITIDSFTEPSPCGEGCVEAEVQAILHRRLNYTDGVVTVKAIKRSRKGRQQGAGVTIETIISSSSLIKHLMELVTSESQIDPRLQELSYKGEVISDNPLVTLGSFNIENHSTVELNVLDYPRSIPGFESLTSGTSTSKETGFQSSRLMGTAVGASEEASANTWTCETCTFINSAPAPCEMCGQR